MAGIQFQDEVTHVPAAWAQTVNDVVFGVLGGNTTLEGVRAALGFGSMATQQADNVSISGGQINNTTIGLTDPAPARFDWALIDGTPIDLKHATNKEYVDALFRRSTAGDSGLIVLQAAATTVAGEYNVFGMDDLTKHKVVAVSFSVAGTNSVVAAKLNGIDVKKIDRTSPMGLIPLSVNDIPREALFMPDLIESTWILLNPISYMGGGGGGGNVYQDALGSDPGAPATMFIPAYVGPSVSGAAHVVNSYLGVVPDQGLQYRPSVPTDMALADNSIALAFNQGNSYYHVGPGDVVIGGENVTTCDLNGYGFNVLIGGQNAEIAPNNRADGTSPANHNTLINAVSTYVQSNDYLPLQPIGNVVIGIRGQGVEGGSVTVAGEDMTILSVKNSSSNVVIGGSRSVFMSTTVGENGNDVYNFVRSLVASNDRLVPGGTQENVSCVLVGNSNLAFDGVNQIGLNTIDCLLHGHNNALINSERSNAQVGTRDIYALGSVGQDHYSNSMVVLPQRGLGYQDTASVGRNMLITMHSAPAYAGLLLCGMPAPNPFDPGTFLNTVPTSLSEFSPNMLSLQTVNNNSAWAFDAQILVYTSTSEDGITADAYKAFRVYGGVKTSDGGVSLQLIGTPTVEVLATDLGQDSLTIQVRIESGTDVSHLSFYIWDTYLDSAYHAYANATVTVTELNNMYVYSPA